MRTRSLRAVRVLLTGLVAGWAIVAFAQQPRLEALVARNFAAYASNDALLERTVDQTYGPGLERPKREVTKAMLRATMTNPGLATYIAKALAPLMSTNMSSAELNTAMFETMLSLQVKGLRRLSTKRQAEFLRYILAVAAAIPASTCKAMFLGTIDPKASVRAERTYMASLPLAGFEAATSIYLEAAQAELAGYPDVKQLNLAQVKATERAYEGAVLARVKKMPPGLNAAVAQNPAGAEPGAACTWYREIVGAALDLPDPFLGWHLTRYTEAMQ